MTKKSSFDIKPFDLSLNGKDGTYLDSQKGKWEKERAARVGATSTPTSKTRVSGINRTGGACRLLRRERTKFDKPGKRRNRNRVRQGENKTPWRRSTRRNSASTDC